MDSLHAAAAGLLSPVTLAFALGALATLLRSDLRIPPQVYTALSIYLLLAIGLKGGHQLAGVSASAIVGPVLATLALGAIVPLLAFPLARLLRFGVVDAGALAAHYGSVSAVTFATVLAFLDARGERYEGFMPALVAVLEVPAILIGIILARRGAAATTAWGPLLHEVLTGKSIVLLVGGMLIGRFSTPDTFERISPVFVNLFYGALVLFMLDLGTVAAAQLREVRQVGVRLIAFAVVMPLVGGMTAIGLGTWAGLSVPGTIVFAVLGASASYIAAPAAVRIALPEANAGLYLTASIAITFPLNLSVGIPLFHAATHWLRG